jgi:uncharacterized protein (TIGR04551 family)
MRRACLVAVLWLVSAKASAQSFGELGQGFIQPTDTTVELDGAFRVRGELLNNLDLDHGLTPSGRPLYPVPLGDPAGQSLTQADMRLRTDVRAYAPFGTARVNARIDVLDNLILGSTPVGGPATTTTQLAAADQVFRIKRVWGEALTPFGVIAAGRMGNTWGLGMLANGGDCADCDSGDAADRLAFITSQWDHFVVVAGDVAWSGPQVARKVNTRQLDIAPTDDVWGLTFAVLRWRDPTAIDRRRAAGRLTLDYGAYASFRWQDDDIPASYVPTTEPVDLDNRQVMRRGFSAQAYDVWVRVVGPALRIELEAAALLATIEEASLVPGVRFDQPVTSTQWGAVLQSEFGDLDGALIAGLDLGVASGDSAYGFGAVVPDGTPAGRPGDLDGAQASPPYDRTVDNFRFHPDYRIDLILFREIIGTVTDATYIRPHVTWHLWRATPGVLSLKVAGVASWALYASSAPGGRTPLGVELDPTLLYTSRDGFGMALDYGVLFPLAGLDNVVAGLSAQPAQAWRLRLNYAF